MIAHCRRDCYDSQARHFYERGKDYDIDPAAPIAKFFDFPGPAATPAPVQPSVADAGNAGKPKDDFLS